MATLGDMARTMGEELDKQNPIITDIDQQVGRRVSCWLGEGMGGG